MSTISAKKQLFRSVLPGGSAFSDAINEIKSAEPDAAVLEGIHISGSRATSAEGNVDEWIDKLNL